MGCLFWGRWLVGWMVVGGGVGDRERGGGLGTGI